MSDSSNKTARIHMDARTFRMNPTACETLHELVNHPVMLDALEICDGMANSKMLNTVEAMAIQGAYSAGVKSVIRLLHELCVPIDPESEQAPQLHPEMMKHNFFLQATQPKQ